MSAPVATVKSAAAQAVADNPDASLRTLTIATFEQAHGRSYDSRTDRNEYVRIKWHVRRALSGDTGPGRGGAREGAGRPKAYTPPQWDGSEEDEWLGQE